VSDRLLREHARHLKPPYPKISKTTPCKVADVAGFFHWFRKKHFDTPGKSVAGVHHPAIRKNSHRACLTAGLLRMSKSRLDGTTFPLLLREGDYPGLDLLELTASGRC
jgi:hypothetical protein